MFFHRLVHFAVAIDGETYPLRNDEVRFLAHRLDAADEFAGEAFGDELIQSGDTRRLYVSLGQFSILRLERDTHLLMPAYDYCMPDKECACGGSDCVPEDPCEVFRQVSFPVSEFFPPNHVTPRENPSPCGCSF